MWIVLLILVLSLPLHESVHAEDLGELSANPFNSDSTSNPFGAGSPFKPDAPRLLARLSGLSCLFGSSGDFPIRSTRQTK
jgi:hypothetical protein